MSLIDPFGRVITGLRMAITPRCNLRCIYCHHEGEKPHLEEISLQTAKRVMAVAASEGIRAFKITGGEPLLRSDLREIVSSASALKPRPSISITTNGQLLSGHAAALSDSGLNRANISIPSVDPVRYRRITGGKIGGLSKAISGVDAAIEAGLHPVKLNMVVLSENQGEIPEMMELARQKGTVLQLIELLDQAKTGLGGDLSAIEARLESDADRIVVRSMHRRRKYFINEAEVEVVRPMDNTEFCKHCSRIRVTSDGMWKPCLLRNDNLLKIDSSSDETIREQMRIAVARREPFFGRDGSRRKAAGAADLKEKLM
jgi:cyclic pyranopterin phosphate synthase